MAENTKIQWTSHTFNPWVGCSKVSEGCLHCYAETLMADRYHRVVWGPRGTRSRTQTWNDPLRWNREAAAAGERRKVFCASLADVFEEWGDGPIQDARKNRLYKSPRGNGYVTPADPTATGPLGGYTPVTMDDLRTDLFRLIDRTGSLDYLLLTKRPENILRMWPDGFPRLRENVWLGTSIANQANADKYIDRLVSVRDLASILFVSLEPQIDFVDLRRWLVPGRAIDWVIIGGESKQGPDEPRRFDIRWATDMVRECEDAGVPCFVKQFGSNAWDGPRQLRLRDSHGGDMSEWPEDLRVRQCPESYFPALA